MYRLPEVPIEEITIDEVDLVRESLHNAETPTEQSLV